MKTKYKDRFSRNMLAEYIKKLKTLNIEKNPKIKAVRNYFKKAKIIVFISLFCLAWNWNHRRKYS